MTHPDFRALYADLADRLQRAITSTKADYFYHEDREAIDHSRAALTDEPVPEGPSDEDIMGLMPQQMHEDLAAAARAMAGFDSPKAAMGAIRNILNCHAVHHARAVLARYGAQAVPVVDVRYEFAVYDALTDEPHAGGEAPTLEEAQREGQHYFAMYSEDGTVRLELRRVEMLPQPEAQP